MSKYLFSKDDVVIKQKHGIDLKVYGDVNEHASIVAGSVEVGHLEEFKNTSWFVYVIHEGEGIFVLDDEQVAATAGDVVSIPPNTRIHYFGSMKYTLVVTPPWNEQNETHVRDVDASESPLTR